MTRTGRYKHVKQAKVENAVSVLLKKGVDKRSIIKQISQRFKIRAYDVNFILFYLTMGKRWESRKEEGNGKDSAGVGNRVIEISYLRMDCSGVGKITKNYLQVENEREYQGIERRQDVIGEFTQV